MTIYTGNDDHIILDLVTPFAVPRDTWTFKLRQGVEFHNGKTVTAEDVVQSYQHHMGEDTKSAAKGIIKSVTEVKADGDDTVVFVLDGGNADFPFIASDYHLNICPAKEEGGIDWESGVGTGGVCMLKEAKDFDPGVRVTVHRNPNYWKENAGYFDDRSRTCSSPMRPRAPQHCAPAKSSRCHNLDTATVPLLKRDDSVVLLPDLRQQARLPHHGLHGLIPTRDNNVRLAVKYAVEPRGDGREDRPRLRQVGNDHPIGPANVTRATRRGNPGQRAYDPDKAKFHLKEAGLDSLDVSFHAADTAFEGAIDAGQLYVRITRQGGRDQPQGRARAQ